MDSVLLDEGLVAASASGTLPNFPHIISSTFFKFVIALVFISISI
jgi:hypothetical protein